MYSTTNLRCLYTHTRAYINSHNAFLDGGSGRARPATLNNAVVFHGARAVPCRAVQCNTRVLVHEKTIDPAAAAGGGRLETYYANVFFIEELRPAPPARVAILPINFHSVEHLSGYIRGLSSAKEQEKKKRKTERRQEERREENVFHSALQDVDYFSPSCRIFSRNILSALYTRYFYCEF